jgi:hypothetical protein
MQTYSYKNVRFRRCDAAGMERIDEMFLYGNYYRCEFCFKASKNDEKKKGALFLYRNSHNLTTWLVKPTVLCQSWQFFSGFEQQTGVAAGKVF